MKWEPCPSPTRALTPDGSKQGSGIPPSHWHFGGNQGHDVLPKA